MRGPTTRQIGREPSSICPFCHDLKKYNDEIDYAEIEAAHNKLQEIDDYLGSSEFRLQSFGEKRR